jgi:hypothetical protein
MVALLTKLAVARRQLATAIELFFNEGDAVSVYSLATNAWEVIDVLCRKAAIESFSVQARENVPKGKDLKRHYINSPYRNFFKHADDDADRTLEPLPDSQVEGVLFLAVEDYIRLNRRSPVQLQVFQLWYLAKYTDKVDPEVAAEVLQGINQAFPDLCLLSRREQLALGARVLARAAEDRVLCEDLRTERVIE